MAPGPGLPVSSWGTPMPSWTSLSPIAAFNALYDAAPAAGGGRPLARVPPEDSADSAAATSAAGDCVISSLGAIAPIVSRIWVRGKRDRRKEVK